MSRTTVIEHLRGALEEIASKEESGVRAILQSSSEETRLRVEMMRNLVEALAIMKHEIRELDDVEIDANEGRGHASVRINEAYKQYFGLSAQITPPRFIVEENHYDTFGDFGSVEKKHEFVKMEEALEFVVRALGKHIGKHRAMTPRPRQP